MRVSAGTWLQAAAWPFDRCCCSDKRCQSSTCNVSSPWRSEWALQCHGAPFHPTVSWPVLTAAVSWPVVTATGTLDITCSSLLIASSPIPDPCVCGCVGAGSPPSCTSSVWTNHGCCSRNQRGRSAVPRGQGRDGAAGLCCHNIPVSHREGDRFGRTYDAGLP